MRFTFMTWLGILALMVSFSACQDHRIPQAPGSKFRIKKVTVGYENATDYSYSIYTYMSTGLLASVDQYTVKGNSAAVQNSKTVMTYDGQGKILKAEMQLLSSNGAAQWVPFQNYTYEYDKNGIITQIKRYDLANPASPVLIDQHLLEYNVARLPIKQSYTIGTHQWVEQYTYSGGNVVKVDRNDNLSGLSTLVFQYDDKPNPFYGLITGPPSYTIFSANNIITPNQIYTYDSNGLLIKGTLAVSGFGNYITKFEYEPY
ncbi:hypothetical protein [Spirosoma panaciterrae]|uniref:hypothetical protein n=1 Tax=Spirosoma panaciterrae TaxID=496058 RepID=UPI00037A8E41|nr:hypothetical protein [Spirosoma panaciterrae]